MENKQTAVEWLQKALSLHLTDVQKVQFEGLFQQAIGMEKEQIIMAGNFCKKQDYQWVIIADSVNGPSKGIISTEEQYYNETYGKS